MQIGNAAARLLAEAEREIAAMKKYCTIDELSRLNRATQKLREVVKDVQTVSQAVEDRNAAGG